MNKLNQNNYPNIWLFYTIYTTIPRHDIAEILQMLALNINQPITTISREQFKNPFKGNH